MKRRSKRRGAVLMSVLLGGIALTTFGSVTEAGAILQPVSLSPSSGPPGTVVTVRGSSCPPGPIVSSTQDYVKISSTPLRISVDVPVAANGSWSGRFTVPGSSLAGPGQVEAACFTDGVPSSTTYSPQSFTVTGGANTPTTGHAVGAPAPGSASNIGAHPEGNAGGAANAAAVARGAKRPTGDAAGASTTTTRHRSAWIWLLIVLALAAAAVTAVVARRGRHHVADGSGPVAT